MKKEEIIIEAYNLFEEQKPKIRNKYESLELSVMYLDAYDVLTASTGTAGDDNVGGFLDQWGQ